MLGLPCLFSRRIPTVINAIILYLQTSSFTQLTSALQNRSPNTDEEPKTDHDETKYLTVLPAKLKFIFPAMPQQM